MKKIFRSISEVVLAVAVMLTAVVFDVPEKIAAAAQSGTSDDGLTWTLDDSGTLTISGSGAMANYRWQAIGQRSSAPWGSYKTTVTSIVIENGVTSIGNYAFYSLAKAQTISIANSVTSIGDDVFRDCSSINNIIIPNSVTRIGSTVFQKCDSLESISIPESVTYIGAYAFDQCSSLTSITFPGKLNFISRATFRDCTSLESFIIPSTATSIADYAFQNCSSLTSIDIPSGVQSIGNNTFSGCSSLTSITIPSTVTSIGNSAFINCSGFTSITIPSVVTSIGNSAFKGCTNLNIATFESNDPPTLGTDVFADAAVIGDSGIIYVPCGAVDAYKTADNWSAYASVITNDGHKVARHIASKEPTCTETGNKEHWTCGCGEKKYSDADGSAAATDVTIPIDANAHDWGDWSVSEHPAISTDGESKRTCQTNNAHTETKPIPKLTDTVWTKTETTKPTVSGTGSYTYTSDYGTVTVTVPKLSDTVWTKVETTKPTINTDGEYTYTGDYGTVTVNDVPKLTDTVWTKTETTKPTVSGTGSYTYTSDYGTVTVTVPKLTDTVWTKIETTKPTINTDGSYTYTSDYGTVTATVPKLNDTSVWTKDEAKSEAATEDKAGKDVYTSVYGTVTVTIPQLGHTHTLTHVDEIPATETTEGVKEHWYCSGCKKDFTDENGTTEISDLTIPVIGHTHTLTHISATETTKEHWHCDCGKDFLDENGEHEATADDLKTGMIEKEVQSGDNAPAATLTTPADELINAVLTEEDKELVNEGKDIKIILTIDDAANKVSNADKAAVEAAIGNESGFILGQCLDVNLLKIIDGRQEKIAQTSTPLTITFEIPVGLRGSGRTFSVIRVHDGETTILEDKDENADTVTIETDKFSTYALAYSENTNVTPPGGGSSGGNAPAPSVSKPTNSGDTSSESRGSSDNDTVTSSSGETSSTDENNFMPSESMPTDNNENPATGITMSLVPLAAAVIVLTVTIKRKRNK